MASKKGNSKSPRKNSKKATTEAKAEVAVVEERQDEDENKDDIQILEPRQALFLQLYYDPKSTTWGNARGSAIAAGYDENYANQITYRKPEWWLGFVRKQPLIDKIEQHFDEVMNLPSITPAMGAFGPITKTETIVEETGEVYKTGKRAGQPKTKKKRVKVPVYVPNINVIKAKNEVAKIAAPAHDPDRYGRKSGGNNNFIFNMTGDRERFA